MEMKRRLANLLFVMFATTALSCSADTVTLYVDLGFCYCCRRSHRPDELAVFFSLDLKTGVLKSRLITLDFPLWLPGEVPDEYQKQFPLAWSVSEGVFFSVSPTFSSSDTGEVLFQKTIIKKLEAFFDKDSNWNTATLDFAVDGANLDFLASVQFPRLRDQSPLEMSAPWYAVCGQGIVARVPSDREGARWSPTGRAPSNVWWEVSCKVLSAKPWTGISGMHEQDGYTPCVGVPIMGKIAQSDSSDFALPGDLDWLIWERNGDASRLCQVSGGRWSVCNEVPFADIPKIVVVNNDENSVFFSFSHEFNNDDVAGSMKRLIAHLQDNEALHIDRLKIKERNAKDENSETDDNRKTDDVVRVRRIGSNECSEPKTGPKPKEPSRLDLNNLSPEEMAKKGAELYERPETRKEGLAILKKSASEGSPFAMARLSALYYLGEGGCPKNYAKSLRLMKGAVARGFPSFLLPIAEAEAALKREKKAREKPLSVLPGNGYPGRLDRYPVSSQLKGNLDRFNLSAGWFRRNTLPDEMPQSKMKKDLLSNEIPYLLFTPDRGQRPVPLVVYFGGLGEQGTDLAAHFHQTTIFSKITSREFQKKHPCYLFAPMVPKGSDILCMKSWSPPMADLVCDAMYAVISSANHPKIDTDRIYLTGLSSGGTAAATFISGYPGRFAASVPVAGHADMSSVPDEHPGYFWLLYNENEYASESSRKLLAEIAELANSRGGEFRYSAFPDKGHNAWDKAWREDAVWDWMFSKTLKASSAARISKPAGAASAGNDIASIMKRSVCTASKPGADEGSGPERAIDGLDATCYVSADPFKRGDWWQVEFAEPVSGRIVVKSGYRDGTCRIGPARVETSSDGKRWMPAGRFRMAVGECTFVPRRPVKFLRVVSDSQSGETLVLREVTVY